jgi:hypothetical protein
MRLGEALNLDDQTLRDIYCRGLQADEHFVRGDEAL